MTDEEFKINLPEDFEIDLDEELDDSEDIEEDIEEDTEDKSEPETIEEIVSDTPAFTPNINFSSDFAPQQFVSSQKAISPVLERRPIPQQTNLENELPETFTQTPQETAGEQAQAYDASSDYYSGDYQENIRNPGEITPINPTLNQTIIHPTEQRVHEIQTGWGAPRTQDWEKHYDAKFVEPKKKKRIF